MRPWLSMRIRSPGEGRYARLEREQRWLAVAVPHEAHDPVAITDLYLATTRLRLRRMESAETMVFKLAQKVRLDPDAAEVVKLTNMYLSQSEYETLARLSGATLQKTRWQMTFEGRSFAIDQFEGRLSGLVLAELELSADEPKVRSPPFVVADITDDEQFTGGYLASAPDGAVEQLLQRVASLTASSKSVKHPTG